MSRTKNKTQEIKINEPEVSNSINMNLTHNDVIEVAIQTQLETLEPRFEQLQEDYNKANKVLLKLQDEVLTAATSKPKASAEAKRFVKIIGLLSRALGEEIVPKISNKYTKGDQETLTSREFNRYDSGDPEEYKSPLTKFKTGTHRKISTWNISKRVGFNLSAVVEGSINMNTQGQECVVELSAAEYKDWKNKTQSILDNIATIGSELWETHKQILELKYDERKVKAKVVKMSLSKTQQGRNILTLLESASGVKLLN